MGVGLHGSEEDCAFPEDVCRCERGRRDQLSGRANFVASFLQGTIGKDRAARPTGARMNLTSAVYATALVASVAAGPTAALALDRQALLRCMEAHRGLPPTLRTEACNCVAKRTASLLERLKRLLSGGAGAELAVADECIAATIDAMAGMR